MKNPGLLMALGISLVFATLAAVGGLDIVVGTPISRAFGVILAYGLVRLIARLGGVTPSSLGLVAPKLRSVAAGAAIGLTLVALVVGVMAIGGWYTASWDGIRWQLAGAIFTAFVVALFEELLFRSAWFGAVEPVLGTHVTVAMSAILFGFLHALNPGATAMSSVAIALSAGVLLGYGYAATRDIWFVTSIHAAWNLALGPILGLPVSGVAPPWSVVTAATSGPDVVTG